MLFVVVFFGCAIKYNVCFDVRIASITQGPSICIFKSENPQEVVALWLFVKYLVTNANFQTEFSIASGFVPTLKSVKETKYSRII